MTTYYVKPTGDNTKDGLSSANAWATITYALTQMIANDELIIAAGAYAETVTITTEHITLTGAGSGSVTINKLRLDASYPSVSGLTATSTDSIASYMPLTNIILIDVVGEQLTTLPWADAAIITNCDFTGLVLPLSGDAAAFTNTIVRCGAVYGLYIGVSVGSNITFNNTTILGTNPPNGGIRIANGTNTVFTNTTIEDPEDAIKVSAGATATFIQSNRKVLVGTVGTNTITPTESTLVVADGTYDYRDFIVTPDASIVISETSLWETSGDQNKAWKVEATGDRTITFRLSNMLPSTIYDLKVGGVKVSSAASNGSGVITFPAYSGSFSEKEFTTEKTLLVTTIMTDISLAQYIVSQLRKAVAAGDLTDYNSANRTSSYGNWIYGDAPMLKKLLGNANNFPRISCESLSHSTVSEMGMSDPNHLENDTLKINVWSVRDLVCTVKSTANETIAYYELVDTYALTNLPISEIMAVDDGTTTFIKGTDYNLIDNDSDGFFDSIEWLGADTPANGADFYVDYKRSAAGSELVRLIAQDVNAYLRTWRDWTEKIVWSYSLVSSVPVPYDEQYGIFRYEMVVRFEGINIGETV